MKKTIFALATAAVLAAGSLSAPTTAEARCYGCAVGVGVAAGVIGGAIIGGAIANSAGAYPAYASRPRLRRVPGIRRSISSCLPGWLLGSAPAA